MPPDRASLPDRRTSQAEGWRKIAVADAKAWKARALAAEAALARVREALNGGDCPACSPDPKTVRPPHTCSGEQS